MSLWKLGWVLIWHHLAGWKPRPGYTVMQKEGDSTRYLAVWMERPDE